MILLKKIAGFIFILLGILISLVMFAKLASFITKVAALFKAISEGDSYHISYYVTQLVFVVIGILLIYYLIRQGKEWMNGKEKNESP